jgi:hypothetical protein
VLAERGRRAAGSGYAAGRRERRTRQIPVTLSFRAAHYQSTELTLRTTELTDNAGRPLQAQTSLDARLIGSFDVPPYVNSADQSGAVPFLDIANRYILAGAQYNPQVLAGPSATQIASQLSNPSARWPRPSTGPPRSSSRPSTRSCTTRRPRSRLRAYPVADAPAGPCYLWRSRVARQSQMGSPPRRRSTSMLPRVALEYGQI